MSFSLGLIEVSSLGHAIAMVDDMLKAADVEFVATERRLGGRLVTIVVRGSVSAVTASVAAGKAAAESMGCLKAAEVIARPHHEIFKFLHLDEKESASEKQIPDKMPKTGKSMDKQKKETKAPKTTRSKTATAVSDKKSPRGRKPKQS